MKVTPKRDRNEIVIRFDESEEDLHNWDALLRWCADREHSTIAGSSEEAPRKRPTGLKTASEIGETGDTKPLYVVEQKKSKAVLDIWYNTLRGRFPSVRQPKKPLRSELGMVKKLLDTYDDHVVEKIFKTAVEGWHVFMVKHRGLSEIPTLELVMRFRAELQTAADGGGLTSNTHRAPTGPDAGQAYNDWQK